MAKKKKLNKKRRINEIKQRQDKNRAEMMAQLEALQRKANIDIATDILDHYDHQYLLSLSENDFLAFMIHKYHEYLEKHNAVDA